MATATAPAQALTEGSAAWHCSSSTPEAKASNSGRTSEGGARMGLPARDARQGADGQRAGRAATERAGRATLGRTRARAPFAGWPT